MQRFHFPLQSALEWRHRRLDSEQAALDALIAQKAQMEEARWATKETLRTACETIVQQQVLHSSDLAGLAQFERASQARVELLTTHITQLDRAVEKQRERVQEARREHRLIDRLRSRRFAEWQSRFQRQLDEEAGELFLAKWRGWNDADEGENAARQ